MQAFKINIDIPPHVRARLKLALAPWHNLFSTHSSDRLKYSFIMTFAKMQKLSSAENILFCLRYYVLCVKMCAVAVCHHGSTDGTGSW